MGIAEGIRNELVDLRNEVDACLATRAQSEIRLQSLAQETEEMLARLDSLEALDPRGVPTEAYDTYLDQVQGYNAAVEEWELQAEDLSDLALECDSLVREHNSLAGSLQEFLVGEGILEPEAFPRESVAPGSSS